MFAQGIVCRTDKHKFQILLVCVLSWYAYVTLSMFNVENTRSSIATIPNRFVSRIEFFQIYISLSFFVCCSHFKCAAFYLKDSFCWLTKNFVRNFPFIHVMSTTDIRIEIPLMHQPSQASVQARMLMYTRAHICLSLFIKDLDRMETNHISWRKSGLE